MTILTNLVYLNLARLQNVPFWSSKQYIRHENSTKIRQFAWISQFKLHTILEKRMKLVYKYKRGLIVGI